MDRSKEIYGNKMSRRTYKSAVKSKEKFTKKFGDDSDVNYPIKLVDNKVLHDSFNLVDVTLPVNLTGSDTPSDDFDREKGIILGNIRMGFGHYRISIAMASAAHALGYTPYWMDLNSYPQTTCTKVISAQNDLYSMGSRMSKDPVFNKLVWEPLNYEGFRALSYNASDQKNAELMATVYRNVPKDIPIVGTHVWPAQAALHAGMKYVVNAIPDDWPMALHFAEGSVHTVQCHGAYMGYRILNGMQKKKVLKPMTAKDLVYTGHYVDHELVSNIEIDCQRRVERKQNGQPMRFLLTIGGAGAQKDIFKAIIKHLLPSIKDNKAVLYVNVGDYINVWKDLKKEIKKIMPYVTEHLDDYDEACAFASSALTEEVTGIHAFYHQDIFEAVYITNLLMRSCDVLVTKPSELSFYPVPKLFIRRVGKHEMWGAIHSAEIGDGTLECRDIPHILQMVDLFIEDDDLLVDMCDNIIRNKEMKIYDGAYEVIKIAMGLKEAESRG